MSQTKVLTHRFKKLALALCPKVPATPANSTEVSTTPLGQRCDLILGDNLDLWLEATRAAMRSYRFDDLLFRQVHQGFDTAQRFDLPPTSSTGVPYRSQP